MAKQYCGNCGRQDWCKAFEEGDSNLDCADWMANKEDTRTWTFKTIWYILDEIACKHSATHTGSKNQLCPICDRAVEAMQLCPYKPNPEECTKLYNMRLGGSNG